MLTFDAQNILKNTSWNVCFIEDATTFQIMNILAYTHANCMQKALKDIRWDTVQEKRERRQSIQLDIQFLTWALILINRLSSEENK